MDNFIEQFQDISERVSILERYTSGGGGGGVDLEKVYPVGSIYINATNSTNPATLLGFGTWSAFGAGRVPVGVDTGQTEFDTVEETGGAKAHTLTEAQMPTHSHGLVTNYTNNPSGGYDRPLLWGIPAGATTITYSTNTAGSSQAHNNLQPYIVVYMWKRTA